MKILYFSGSHLRHRYMSNYIKPDAIVVEERENFNPEVPEGLDAVTESMYRTHFQRRAEAENRHYGLCKFPKVEMLKVKKKELNSKRVINFIKIINPDLIISYGVHILSDTIINYCKAWNIHGGLSPDYKGAITHFWASYMLEPQMTGMTLHELTQNLDGGDVIHQTAAELVKGDGVHDLSCRAVKSLAEDIAKLIKIYDSVKTYKHKTTGKIWKNRDWRPEHLRRIYIDFDDDIVDWVLNGLIKGREPKLYQENLSKKVGKKGGK